MRFLRLLCCFLSAAGLFASDVYPPPRFTDPQRVEKLRSASPEVIEIFRRFAAEHKIPGIAWGIVIDSHITDIGFFGFQDLRGSHVDAGTVFRIASMTKSFTALAVLKLRDAGKLSLADPVSKWIPEFTTMPPPTRDSAPVTIRELLSHSAGFPEDNPWGDRQLARSETDLTNLLRAGIPFSTPPGTRYEYSNYGFALLGRIVSRASGVPYEEYVETQILRPLGMNNTTFNFSSLPAGRRARGYRLQPDGTYSEEEPLPNGAFASMGGLLTDAGDLGKYVAFHLSAWPARDDPDPGPVRRSSVREMSSLWRPAYLTARRAGDSVEASASGYGFGLRISSDCRFEHIVGHGGGLPGFGSYMLWLPDYGVGLFAMTNLTYAGAAEPINRALGVLLQTGGLQKRELPPSPFLTEAREQLTKLWTRWDDAEAERLAATNLFLDKPAVQRREEIRKLKEEVGACNSAGPLRAENWLRGQFNLRCEHGIVGVFLTLAPTQPPRVQYLNYQRIPNEEFRLTAPTGAPAGVSCASQSK